MFQALKKKSKRIASTLAAGVLLFSQFAVVPAVGASSLDNPNDWPYWCTVANGFDGGVKFEGSGEKPNDNVTDDTIDGITATYSPDGDNTVEKESVTITTDGTKDVTLVVVKGGNDENGGNEVYDEGDAPFTGLTAPVNPNNEKPFSISHVIVCYDEEDEEDKGSVKVNKEVDEDGDGQYEGGNVEANTLGFEWGLDGNDSGNEMGDTVSDLTVGSHDIDENITEGFEFTGWYANGGEGSCANPDGTGLPFSIDVAKDQTTEVTLCNKAVETEPETGSITIVKDAGQDSETDFDFVIENEEEEDDFLLNGGESKVYDSLSPDTYVVTEEWLEGWNLEDIDCTPSESENIVTDVNNRKVTITLNAGDDVTCTFYNEEEEEEEPKTSSISGYKFEDVNGDGEWNKQDEPTLEGWTIKLCAPEYEESSILSLNLSDYCGEEIATDVTDENGAYSFDDLEQGEYIVCEVQQDGWQQTFPWFDYEEILIDCHYIELGERDEYCVDFGNFEQGRIEGVKFNDINGDHEKDGDEPTLKNWEITLTKECEPEDLEIARVAVLDCQDETWTTKTDANGAYSFSGLEAGDYTVCEVQQANWTQTYPQDNNGCHLVTITGGTSGEVVTADFGNKAKPQVLGEQVTLVVTGATNGTKGMLVGLSILGVLGALHILARRKSYSN